MNKILKINLENCFGIGELKHDFKFSTDKNVQLIYAPNGTMKSSLAKIFDLISKDEVNKIKDRINPDKTVICDIGLSCLNIKPTEILVIDAETKISETSITRFIASKDLKESYDKIYSDLMSEQVNFIKALKNQSGSNDCGKELPEVFENNENIFEYLIRIEPLFVQVKKQYKFNYNDLFDKRGNVKKFLDTHKLILNEYLTRYLELLASSDFFQKSENSFGTLQAKSLLDSLQDNSFFQAGHKISLKTKVEISKKEDLENIIKVEKDRILNDPILLEKFNKVDLALTKNAELKLFKNLLEKDHSLIIELLDYDEFKKTVWLSYIADIKDNALKLINIYKEKKSELEKIIEKANSESEKWKNIIELFNSRFYVPFELQLENQSDMILKSESPKLVFKYNGNFLQDNDENNLLEILSRGESRAYYILKFLFEIESRLDNDENLFLIFDDVADSFDYKNKYAIIEYIKDLVSYPKVKALILTHNFDFYRTLATRLDIKNNSYMASKDQEEKIILNKGQYFEDVFNNIFIKNYKNKINFIGVIPFARNMLEYLSNEEQSNFLTSCLHIKENTKNILIKDVHNSLLNLLPAKKDIELPFENEKLLDVIFSEADKLAENYVEHSIDLELKLLIAIACRLKAELYMSEFIDVNERIKVKKNQTQEFYKLCITKGVDLNALKVLNRVNLITPEHIHLNSFMFEPLVDMSIKHLIDLYNDIGMLYEINNTGT